MMDLVRYVRVPAPSLAQKFILWRCSNDDARGGSSFYVGHLVDFMAVLPPGIIKRRLEFDVILLLLMIKFNFFAIQALFINYLLE